MNPKLDSAVDHQIAKVAGCDKGQTMEDVNNENGVADENGISCCDKNLGAGPKYLPRNDQNEKQEQSMPHFSQKGLAHREPHTNGRNLDFSKLMKCSDKERSEHGLFWRHSGLQSLEHDGNMLGSMKGEEKGQPDKEDIPGFLITQMKELLKMDSTDVLIYLSERLKGFISLLNKKLSPEMIMLVVEILAKISSSHLKEKQAALLTQSIQPGILEQISLHSFNIVAQKMPYTQDEIIKYFENIYTLFKDTVDILPYKASEVLLDHPAKAVMALQSLKAVRKVSVPPKLEEDYKILMTSVESLLELHRPRAPKESRVRVKREWQPGNDFRKLNIHPLPQDLLCKIDVNLCPVVVNGPYKSVEHYLDVQFNLIREDFLIPLRDGIADYVEQRSSKSNKLKRVENVRFYNNVRFLQQFIEGDVIVTEVLFNPRAKSSRHNWKRSKRLMYGSLLCFTSDMFSTIVLGVIVDRSVDRLKKGILRCELIGDVKYEGVFKKEFILAECEVYFEAYQHVMKALQNFNEANFPLKEYLIDVSSDLHHPTYLANHPGAVYQFGMFKFTVLDEKNWPTMKDMNVNESQLKALHSALTKKCVVIQGPPGTGKTYLGLKIAELLLKNSVHWRKNGRGQYWLYVSPTMP